MFYICDCSDLMNIGVKDTKDGSIEYFSSFKLQSLVNQGIDIAGVSENDSIFEVSDDSYGKYYFGDFLAPSRFDALATLDNLYTSKARSLPGDLYKVAPFYTHDAITRHVNKSATIVADLYDNDWIRYVWVERLLPRFASFNVIEPEFQVQRLAIITDKSLSIKEYPELFKNQVFILQRVSHNGDLHILYKRVSTWCSSIESLDTFYKNLCDGNIIAVNAKLTESGFEYEGLDGYYRVDINRVKAALGTGLSKQSIKDSTRNRLFGKGVSLVKENGVLARLEISPDGYFRYQTVAQYLIVKH